MKNATRIQVKWFYLLTLLGLALTAGVIGSQALAAAPSTTGARSAQGQTPNPTNTPCPRGTPIVFQINIVNMSYQPPQAFFPAGTMVRWTNMDSAPHSTTSDNNLWDSGPLATGQSFEFLIQNPGMYNYHDSANQQLRGLLNVGTVPCGPPPTPRTGTPQVTPPPRTGTPQFTPPPRTGSPQVTPPPHTGTPQPPPPCENCHLGILAVTNSCNPMDSAVSWIAIVHNPDRCVVRAPWRAELQIEENGKWRPVRMQFANFAFPPGDGVVRGAFCFQAGPNVRAQRVEFMFENGPGGVTSPQVRDVASAPNRYSNTPNGGSANEPSANGSGKDTTCNMHRAAQPIPVCQRREACPPPPPPPGTPPPGTPRATVSPRP